MKTHTAPVSPACQQQLENLPPPSPWWSHGDTSFGRRPSGRNYGAASPRYAGDLFVRHAPATAGRHSTTTPRASSWPSIQRSAARHHGGYCAKLLARQPPPAPRGESFQCHTPMVHTLYDNGTSWAHVIEAAAGSAAATAATTAAWPSAANSIAYAFVSRGESTLVWCRIHEPQHHQEYEYMVRCNSSDEVVVEIIDGAWATRQELQRAQTSFVQTVAQLEQHAVKGPDGKWRATVVRPHPAAQAPATPAPSASRTHQIPARLPNFEQRRVRDLQRLTQWLHGHPATQRLLDFNRRAPAYGARQALCTLGACLAAVPSHILFGCALLPWLLRDELTGTHAQSGGAGTSLQVVKVLCGTVMCLTETVPAALLGAAAGMVRGPQELANRWHPHPSATLHQHRRRLAQLAVWSGAALLGPLYGIGRGLLAGPLGAVSTFVERFGLTD